MTDIKGKDKQMQLMGRHAACDETRLKKLLKENGAALCDQPEKYTKQSRVNFICRCGEQATKSLGILTSGDDILCNACKRKMRYDQKQQAPDMRAIVHMIMSL